MVGEGEILDMLLLLLRQSRQRRLRLLRRNRLYLVLTPTQGIAQNLVVVLFARYL